MERRKFIETAGAAGLLTALGGGMWGKSIYAKTRLSDSLVSEALPIITEKAHWGDSLFRGFL